MGMKLGRTDDIITALLTPHQWGKNIQEIHLSLLNERYLKVEYPQTSSLNFHRKLEALGKRTLRSSVLQRVKPFARRISSVTEPSGRISIMDDPENYRGRTSDEHVVILTANLWHDWPRQRRLRERLECFVELVQKEAVDILLLQELTRTKDFKTDQWLADQLGMAYVYSRANGDAGEIGFEEGLAVFSRFPIKKPRLAQLSDHKNPFFRRIALGTLIEIYGENLLAFTVHLGINGRQNESQIFRLINWVEKQSGSVPAVIGGDFNARENTSQIRNAQNSWQDSFREFNPDDDGFTHEIQWPWGGTLTRSRLDYLFLRKGNIPWIVDEARHIEIDECSVSDHTPVLIKARIPRDRIKSSSENDPHQF